MLWTERTEIAGGAPGSATFIKNGRFSTA